MDIESLQEICSRFPGVTEDIKWEHNLCFCVATKVFLLVSLDTSPPSASFKINEEDFDELSALEGFQQAPYFAKRQWIRVDDISRMGKHEWQQRAQQAYELIKSKLPKKVQASL